jgi:hypothetical protein
MQSQTCKTRKCTYILKPTPQADVVRSLRVYLLDSIDTLVQRAVDRRSDCERTANDSAETHEETRERLVANFTIDDFHRRDVL